MLVDVTTSALATAVSPLSAVSLASVLDQSADCFKLLTMDGKIQYMNNNGLCAMEIEEFSAVEGTFWADLLPEPARQNLVDAYPEAATGKIVQFRAFIPTIKGNPRWWDISVSPVTDDKGRMVGFLSVSRDVTVNHQSREALKIAASEMKHRLRNTYQTITSLMVMTARGNAGHEEFAKQMADRLGALSRAQSLFTDDDAPCDLNELIPALVTPFGSEAAQVSFDPLPAIAIRQSQADAVALVVGELAVNSSKHGAFAHGGAVHVTAAADENDVLAIIWRERCDLPVQQRSREGGQGLKLMDQIMRSRDGSIVVEWEAHGMVATLELRLAAESRPLA